MCFYNGKNNEVPTEEELYERVKFILLLVSGAILGIFLIILVWFAFFKTVIDKPSAENLFYTISILVCIPISTVYIYKKSEMSFWKDAEKFYIFNSVLTYIVFNVIAIFMGDFCLASVFWGVFLFGLLSVIPTLIIVPIIIAIKKRK